MKRSVLIASATSVVMIGALFVPLPVREQKEHLSIPMQRSATIVLSQRTNQPQQERSESLTQDEYIEHKPLPTPEISSPIREEQITEHKDEALASQASVSSVAIESYSATQIKEEALVAMKVYHEIEGSIEPPVFDLKLLSSLLVYPPAAKRQNKEGLVRLRLYISEQGIIERIVVEEDPGYGLAEATVKAFEQMTPKPATQDTIPIAVTMVFPIRWTLK